jgi:hypothetical protein
MCLTKPPKIPEPKLPAPAAPAPEQAAMSFKIGDEESSHGRLRASQRNRNSLRIDRNKSNAQPAYRI